MLTVIATPIGDLDEITIKALKKLSEAEIIICESTKETSKLLRHHGISGKIYEVLNEHSLKTDLGRLTKLCYEKNVALVSDCGTPGFCDPGSDLVESCRKEGIPIVNCLGASSLMGLISLSGVKLNDFIFRGFVPQETGARMEAYRDIQTEIKQRKRPVVLMDTPYRLQKMVDEVVSFFNDCHIVLATDLGTPEEQVLIGSPSQVKQNLTKTKAEFMILVKPR